MHIPVATALCLLGWATGVARAAPLGAGIPDDGGKIVAGLGGGFNWPPGSDVRFAWPSNLVSVGQGIAAAPGSGPEELGALPQGGKKRGINILSPWAASGPLKGTWSFDGGWNGAPFIEGPRIWPSQ